MCLFGLRRRQDAAYVADNVLKPLSPVRSALESGAFRRRRSPPPPCRGRRRPTDERPPQRQALRRIPCHRDADEIAVADDAVGRIEIDPSRARQIDLQPGMGRAAAERPIDSASGTKM